MRFSFSIALILCALVPRAADAGLPNGPTSDAGAVYDSLCAGNASDPLVVELVVHGAFDTPVINWPAAGMSVRCADGLGPSIPADSDTDANGYTTFTTTVGAILGSGCCDSLEATVDGYFTIPVERIAAPLPTVPDCMASDFSVQHADICPTFPNDPVVVSVTLRSVLDVGISGFPAESLTVTCLDSGLEVPADGPTDAHGQTTFTMTVSDLIDTTCCNTLLIHAGQGFDSCEDSIAVGFGPYSGPYPNLEIPNPMPQAEDRFGVSAAPFGDDFLIGATGDGLGGSATRVDGESGAVVFHIPTPSADNDRFGSGVLDLDGRVLVADNAANGNFLGSLYVYDDTGNPLFEIPDPEPEPGDRFGTALALVNGILFAGAPGDAVGAVSSAGTVYAFDATTGGPLFDIENPDPQTDAGFGAALATRGNDLVVGAPGHNSSDGAVYILDAGGSELLMVKGPASGAVRFGARVRSLGNDLVVGASSGTDLWVLDGTNGDERFTIPLNEPLVDGALVTTDTQILFGLPREDNVIATDAGYAYVHDGLTGALVARIRHPLPKQGDRFGLAVAATESSMLITAPWHATRTGTAYLYANGPTGAPTAVSPRSAARLDVRPNPFRHSTAIAFSLPRAGVASLTVHDVTGRLVRRLEGSPLGPGPHVLEWDGRDARDVPVVSGVYFVRLRTDDGSRTGRVVRMR